MDWAAEEERIARLCLGQGVLLDPLSRYAVQPPDDSQPPAFVMRYGNLTPSSLEHVTRVFQAVLADGFIAPLEF